jgi:hypothetical protein
MVDQDSPFKCTLEDFDELGLWVGDPGFAPDDAGYDLAFLPYQRIQYMLTSRRQWRKTEPTKGNPSGKPPTP